MKKVIVTGATGFIGSSLVTELLSRDIVVYGIGTDEKKFEKFDGCKNFYKIVADFEEYRSLPKVIKNIDIDVFYHLAWEGGFTSAIRDYRLQMMNAGFAGDAVVAAKECGCEKFVYAGTYNEFEIRNFLSKEDFNPRYTCIYSIGKTAADLICRTLCANLKMKYNTAYIPMPYGENNYSMQLMNVVLLNLINEISPKLVEGNNYYDIVYIDDIVDALLRIGEDGIDKRGYYIGHRKLKTFREWMEDIRDIVAPNVKLKFGEYIDRQDIDYNMIDLDGLYRDTGFVCKADFQKSIERTAEWVRGNLLYLAREKG